MLKQGKTSPMDVEKQVVIIYAVVNNYLKEIAVSDVSEYEKELLTHIEQTRPEILASIRDTGALTDENEQALKSVLEEYAKKFLQTK